MHTEHVGTGQLATVVAVLVAAMSIPAHAGSVVYVDDDARPGGNGSSWESPYQFLQDALAFAADPTHGVAEIRVAQGLYRPAGPPQGSLLRYISFELISGVALRGGYAGFGAPELDERDIELYETILSGDLALDDGNDWIGWNDNSYHVVAVAGGVTGAVLEGFTVTAGYADGSGDDNYYGAGLNNYGSIVVSRCRFTENLAIAGGSGLYNVGVVSVLDCVFESNEGVCLANGGSARLERSEFISNDGGGVFSY